MATNGSNGASAPAIGQQAYPITDHTFDVIVVGAGGRMGRTLIHAAAANKDLMLVGAVEAAASAVIGRDAGELAGAVDHRGAAESLGQGLISANGPLANICESPVAGALNRTHSLPRPRFALLVDLAQAAFHCFLAKSHYPGSWSRQPAYAVGIPHQSLFSEFAGQRHPPRRSETSSRHRNSSMRLVI